MILAGTNLLRVEQSNVEKIQKNPEILFPSSLNLFQLSIRSDGRGHAYQYFRIQGVSFIAERLQVVLLPSFFIRFC